MDQYEARKSIQKAKSTLIFFMVFIVLCVPAILKTFSQTQLWVALSMVSFIFLASYKRVRRLNYKLKSLQ